MVAGAFNSREARWNNNSAYRQGFHDDAQLVIDDIAKGNSFASKVAQSVKQNNYRISEKQAYVIAKEAVETKNKYLYSSRDNSPKAIFQKEDDYYEEKVKRDYKFPDRKTVRKAFREKGLTMSERDYIDICVFDMSKIRI